jgi:hypothetical protein
VLVRVGGELRFVSAAFALRVAPPPQVTAVPGAPTELLGVAAYEGMIIPVISIGAVRREMIVCQHAGELVGLLGGEVVQTGAFDDIPGSPDVQHGGERAAAVDVPALYGRVQASARPNRWAP